MGLEERVAELERRMAELESGGPAAPPVGEGDFWALDALKERHPVTRDADGAVMFTGAVRVPTGHRYEWQYGQLTEALFDDDCDWQQAAESFAALGNPVRLRLLREILGGVRTAAELAALADIGTTGQIYHHLRQLTGAGWLHTPDRGRYEVPAGRVVPLLVLLTAARPVT
ncbi:helix-turn-helix domain-containing protein [Streptomyces sp. NPDC006422]|uniref:ArsR/SmtB family transcription factor n=1 Tax=unclassified Streptomyces TaxID=2593676 RepID=UPI0033BD1E56